jgi:uncharacterized membrane protein YdbT with pleckstrin-like domain
MTTITTHTVIRDIIFVLFGVFMFWTGYLVYNYSPFLYYFAITPSFISLFLILEYLIRR